MRTIIIFAAIICATAGMAEAQETDLEKALILCRESHGSLLNRVESFGCPQGRLALCPTTKYTYNPDFVVPCGILEKKFKEKQKIDQLRDEEKDRAWREQDARDLDFVRGVAGSAQGK